MSYGETKVYFDGSHYIAIPHRTRPSKKKPKPPEEYVEVLEEINVSQEESTPSENDDVPFSVEEEIELNIEQKQVITTKNNEINPLKRRLSTKKQIFEEVYRKSFDVHKKQRRKYIIDAMRPYFPSHEKTKEYVNINLDRKARNLISRRIRLTRKANLQQFNYFCTFTYDNAKHSEETFRKKLKDTLSNFAKRKEWKYIGVWERSPDKKRLHFHGLFSIPFSTIPGDLSIKKDYNFNKRRMVQTLNSSYFEERFGRNDFEPIDNQKDLGYSIAYLLKYIEKTGEKIVYSRGLPQYFISDIMDEDIVCYVGQEDQKLLLFDDFSCWDEGCYMGQVSSETISQMRTVN